MYIDLLVHNIDIVVYMIFVIFILFLFNRIINLLILIM